MKVSCDYEPNFYNKQVKSWQKRLGRIQQGELPFKPGMARELSGMLEYLSREADSMSARLDRIQQQLDSGELGIQPQGLRPEWLFEFLTDWGLRSQKRSQVILELLRELSEELSSE